MCAVSILRNPAAIADFTEFTQTSPVRLYVPNPTIGMSYPLLSLTVGAKPFFPAERLKAHELSLFSVLGKFNPSIQFLILAFVSFAPKRLPVFHSAFVARE